MSTLIANKLQVGQSITTENNTLITSTSDGLIISNGVDGSSTQVAKIDKFGNIVANSIVTSQGAISGDRNRVINGSCQIVNVASVASVGGSVVYGGPELFAAFESASAGGQFTQSQGSMTFGSISLPTVRQTVDSPIVSTASANTWAGILTYIEGFNSFDLRGKSVALSFVFNTNVSGTYSVSIRDSAASQSFVSTFIAVANTPVQVSIPASAIPLAASIPNSNAIGLILTVGSLNTGTAQTATLNAWQSGSFVSATNATNWGATAGNFIELTNLQLEEGTVATPFIRRSYQQELALTQRYYWEVKAAGGTIERLALGQCTATTGAQFVIHAPVAMRAAPAAMFTTGVLTDYQVLSSAGAGVAITAGPTLQPCTTTTMFITANTAGSLTAGNATQLRVTNANAYLGFSARL